MTIIRFAELWGVLSLVATTVVAALCRGGRIEDVQWGYEPDPATEVVADLVPAPRASVQLVASGRRRH